ncbi:hypothetical protein J3F83DRAFT_456044 [Trichoderma novae-zelandiae]
MAPVADKRRSDPSTQAGSIHDALGRHTYEFMEPIGRFQTRLSRQSVKSKTRPELVLVPALSVRVQAHKRAPRRACAKRLRTHTHIQTHTHTSSAYLQAKLPVTPTMTTTVLLRYCLCAAPLPVQTGTWKVQHVLLTPQGSSGRRGAPPPRSLQVSLETGALSCPVDLACLVSALTSRAAALPGRRFIQMYLPLLRSRSEYPMLVLYCLGPARPYRMASWLGYVVCPRSMYSTTKHGRVSECKRQSSLCPSVSVLYSVHCHLLETDCLWGTAQLAWFLLGLGALCHYLHEHHLWFARFRIASFSGS